MKKIITLLFILFSCVQLFAQSENIKLANQFLEDFKAKKFEALSAYFDPSILDPRLPVILKDSYTRMTEKYGELKTGEAEEITSGGFQTVKIALLNQPQDITFYFRFNEAHKLLGFNSVPKPKISLYKDPIYADKNLYTEEKIEIQTGEFRMPGILTRPKNKNNYPIAILVHGSGANDMDETTGNTKIFRDMALGLAAKGIATIRYHKRLKMYGLKSAPIGKNLSIREETVEDAISAIKLAQTLSGIDAKKIFLIGHSLGAMLAPMIATENKDLAGIIMMSGPARSYGTILKDQLNYLIKDKNQLEKQLKIADEIEHADTVKDQNKFIRGIYASYFTEINKYNQVQTAKDLKLPMLLLQGERDYQVTTRDLNIWKDQLTKNKNVTIKSYPKLNHAYTEGEGIMSPPSEYNIPANTPIYVIDDISNWMLKKIR